MRYINLRFTYLLTYYKHVNVIAYVEFVHHFHRNVVGQVPIFVCELLQELVKLHARWTSS